MSGQRWAAALLCAAAGGLGAFAQEPAAQARQIVETTGVAGGLVVHLGCGDPAGAGQAGALTAALRAGEAFVVQGLDSDPAAVERARATLRAAGVYGSVSAEVLSGGSLPYADNLVRLLVVSRGGDVPRAEMERVLCPGGVLLDLQPAASSPGLFRKPWPAGMDEWPQYLYDASGNPVSKDTLAGPPRSLRWTAGPRWQRSHNYDVSLAAMVSARGRLFYFLDEGPAGVHDDAHPQSWNLVARDAFNGVVLWKRPLSGWGPAEWKGHAFGEKTWATPFTLNRRMLAIGDRVYATLKYRAPVVTVLDGATGRTLREIEAGDNVDEMIARDGALYLRVRKLPPPYDAPRMPGPQDNEGRNKRTDVVADWMKSQPDEQVVAVDAETGSILWRAPAEIVHVETMAALNGRVCYRDWDSLVALDAKTGKELWRTPLAARLSGHFSRGFAGLLLLHGDQVLTTRPDGFGAFDAATGRELWKKTGYYPSYGYFSPVSTRVAQGLVWSHFAVGLDPVTGKEVRKIDVGQMNTGKIRCYRAKATERYLFDSFWGLQCTDLTEDGHSAEMWVRGDCSYGLMPANGMIYSTPNPCNCFMGTLIGGFNALAPQRPAFDDGVPPLEKGPAFAETRSSSSGPPPSEDWPTYRRDARRSGHAATPVPAELTEAWAAPLGGALTAPVVAGARVYVARKDTHEVISLDATAGGVVWRFTAGGPVNSPPTIADGRAVFGCADGWVYCLRADDGVLAWRRRAAPADFRILDDGRIESAWPCDGSLLVQDALVYAAAGRSSFLDGGLFLAALDLRTGETRHTARLDGPWPTVEEMQNPIKQPMNRQTGSQRDLLVSQGGVFFMNQVRFSPSLTMEPTAVEEGTSGQRRLGAHLMATGGFLDDSLWHRVGWQYADQWPGFANVHASANAGTILSFDGERSFAASHYNWADRYPDHKPGEGNLIVCDLLSTTNVYRGTSQKRSAPPVWSVPTPLVVRALLTAPARPGGPADRVFVSGVADVARGENALEPYRAGGKAMLMVLSAADGRTLNEMQWPSAPVWDGLAAAGGRLFVVTVDGRVVSLHGGMPK